MNERLLKEFWCPEKEAFCRSDEAKTIDLLRMALAAIWTEMEKDEPNYEDVQQIAGEAIDMTMKYARPKVPSLDQGMESWIKEAARYNDEL